MSLPSAVSLDTRSLMAAPAVLRSPDDLLTHVLSAVMLFALVVYVFNRILHKQLSLLPPKKAYDALYTFSGAFFVLIAGLLAVPAFSSLVDYVLNDNVDMTLPDELTKSLLLRSMYFAVAPVIFDLCGRRKINLMTMIHHLATCLITIVHMDQHIATPMAVYYALTSSLMAPLEFAIGLYSFGANARMTAKWLTYATFHSFVVFTLAQIGVLRSMWKAYHHALSAGEYDSTQLTVVFVASLVVDVLLYASQIDHVLMIRILAAKRRRESLGKDL